MANNKSWLWGVVGAVLAVGVTLAVVQLTRNDDDPSPAAGDPTPGSTPTEPTESPSGSHSSPPPSESTFTVAAYFLGQTGRGPQLYREFQRVEGADAATAAVRAVLEGPVDPDYASPWATSGADVGTVSGDKELVTVDLLADAATIHDRTPGMDEATATLAIEQLMRTAQGAMKAGRAPVQLLVNGKHIDTIFGQPTSEPLANAEDADVLAHVWVNSPTDGAGVAAGATVEGLASSFEASVTWELKQGDRVVEQGFTTAAEAFTMAPYSFELPQVAPGDYTLVVSEDDPSGGEGSGPDSDSKRVTFG